MTGPQDDPGTKLRVAIGKEAVKRMDREDDSLDHCCTCDEDKPMGWPEAISRMVIALAICVGVLGWIWSEAGALPWQ